MLTVVKCGGAVDVGRVAADVADRRSAGDRVVVVHGGAGDIARLAAQMRVPGRSLRSPTGITSRYTDAATLDVVTLALTGRIKPRLLAALHRVGVPAVGLTGLDGGLLRADRKPARRAVDDDGRVRVVRDDLSGRIVSVDPTVLLALLSADLTPVASPPAAAADGTPLNVDADRVAAAIAGALGADRLVLLTAAPGLLRDVAEPASLLSDYVVPDAGTPGHAASDGMHRKLVAAREALRAGVSTVRIADGRVRHPLAAALAGAGTRITLEQS